MLIQLTNQIGIIMNRDFPVTIIAFLFLSCGVLAEEIDGYVDGSTQFVLIEDVNRQAEAWATCAATYEIMATIFETSNPSQAQQYHDMSNGAALSVAMTHVLDGFEEDITPERFNSLWNYSKVLIQSLPETQTNMILADAERYSDEDVSSFYSKLGATAEVCVSNLDGQQEYIDLWRDLAKSGLLIIPNE